MKTKQQYQKFLREGELGRKIFCEGKKFMGELGRKLWYISQLMKDNFYFFSASLIVLSLTILASQINQKDNTLNK